MSERPKIKQGDAGTLGVPLFLNKQPVTEDDLPLFHCIEFFIGEGIRKMWPDEAFFANGKFHVPYTQAESFQLEEGDVVEVDVRIHFETNGAPPQVKGLDADFPKIKVVKAESRKELS